MVKEKGREQGDEGRKWLAHQIKKKGEKIQSTQNRKGKWSHHKFRGRRKTSKLRCTFLLNILKNLEEISDFLGKYQWIKLILKATDDLNMLITLEEAESFKELSFTKSNSLDAFRDNSTKSLRKLTFFNVFFLLLLLLFKILFKMLFKILLSDYRKRKKLLNSS